MPPFAARMSRPRQLLLDAGLETGIDGQMYILRLYPSE